MKKILIVEDEVILADQIEFAIKELGYAVDVCNNGNRALEYLSKYDYDLIITDLMMSPIDGYDILRFIEIRAIKVPVFIISALKDEKNISEALDMGAIDYIEKPINIGHLKLKIGNFFKYITVEEQEIFLIEQEGCISIGDRKIVLSKTEYDIFALLHSNKNTVFTKNDLLDKIWNKNYEMSDKVVEVNIFNIRKKLGGHSSLIRTIRSKGYMYDDQK